MATIAGGVMAAYVQLLGNSYALANQISLEAARHLFAEQLLGASLMAAPAALIISKIIHPETETPVTKGYVSAAIEIGRASCRENVELSECDVGAKVNE